MRAPVVISAYDPAWPALFEELRGVYASALGSLGVRIEHVGSTAVPGLGAKPVIDVDVILRVRSDFDEAARRLLALGYAYQGDLGIAGREAFTRRDAADVPRDGSGRRFGAHNLYVCDPAAQEHRRHLLFRDALRADRLLAFEYETLKRWLAEKHRDDRDAYCDGKSAFVESVLRGAHRRN